MGGRGAEKSLEVLGLTDVDRSLYVPSIILVLGSAVNYHKICCSCADKFLYLLARNHVLQAIITTALFALEELGFAGLVVV